jgi:hypothetical protein
MVIPWAMELTTQEVIPPKTKIRIIALKKFADHLENSEREAPGDGGVGKGKDKSNAVKRIPVINPAMRKGKKKSTNLYVYIWNVMDRISPTDNSRDGFSKRISHRLPDYRG